MKDADQIKCRLIEWLLRGNAGFRRDRDMVAVEVRFSSNQRRADVLLLDDLLHALEIKGDYDNLQRLRQQLRDYSRTFDKVSIVTTSRHLKGVRRIVGRGIGLILFTGETFVIKRKPRTRRRLDKASLLTFLDRNTIQNMLNCSIPRKVSTYEIRKIAASRLTNAEIQAVVRTRLRRRYKRLFQLLLRDTGGTIMPDDLAGLRGRIDGLSI